MRFPAEREGARLYTLPGTGGRRRRLRRAADRRRRRVGLAAGRGRRGARAAGAGDGGHRALLARPVLRRLPGHAMRWPTRSASSSAGGRLAFALAAGRQAAGGRRRAAAGGQRAITERRRAARATPSPLELLSDELRTRPVNGAGEVLEVVMLDRRGCQPRARRTPPASRAARAARPPRSAPAAAGPARTPRTTASAPAGLLELCLGADERAQPGRVHELEPTEVDDHRPPPVSTAARARPAARGWRRGRAHPTPSRPSASSSVVTSTRNGSPRQREYRSAL